VNAGFNRAERCDNQAETGLDTMPLRKFVNP